MYDKLRSEDLMPQHDVGSPRCSCFRPGNGGSTEDEGLLHSTTSTPTTMMMTLFADSIGHGSSLNIKLEHLKVRMNLIVYIPLATYLASLRSSSYMPARPSQQWSLRYLSFD